MSSKMAEADWGPLTNQNTPMIYGYRDPALQNHRQKETLFFAVLFLRFVNSDELRMCNTVYQLQ